MDYSSCCNCWSNTKRGCKERSKNVSEFFMGSSGDYVGCVLCYGLIPGIVAFLLLIILGVLLLLLVNRIAGIVIMCLAPIIGFAFIFFAALYSYCYTKKYNTIHVKPPSCCIV